MSELFAVKEILPRDLALRFGANPDLVILDVREREEFDYFRIEGALNVPMRFLESACTWDNEKTVPELAAARKGEIVVICRSGYRSFHAAAILQSLGYEDVVSLKTGLSGWSDFESKSRSGSRSVYGGNIQSALSA
ncbi:MAG: rhodanese-like domain-containing protein [Chlorobiaceae bacterium]|nr:rhodanese-like domain-containing protein [Chlorobiaceae bacterium]